MSEKILMGQGAKITSISREDWEQGLSLVPQHVEKRLNFMSGEHHLVRNFVVKELPIRGEPLSPEFIAQELDLTIPQTIVILADLEKHLTFLFRNRQGQVVWAYPVTVDKTPHHVTFNTGEQLYAA